jgi:exosortase E/protease (VPEID-CTERM system)
VPAVSGARTHLLPHLALLLLLVVEVFALTVGFDTEDVDRLAPVARLVGRSPQLLRLLIAVLAVTLFLGGRRLVADAQRQERPRSASGRLMFLALHACALLLFIRVTVILFSGVSSAAAHPYAWSLLWYGSGAAAVATWGATLWSRHDWWRLLRTHRRPFGGGVVLGAAAWAVSLLTGELWIPLARWTYALVAWMLAILYPQIISDPATLLIGTPTFKAIIAPECSGYEGIGLVLTFLSVYLWVFKRELRFPRALLLLPLGAITIWLLNAVRIVALVAIGSAGWKEVARGGFHSQAGWLIFNAVALGFIAVAHHVRYLKAAAPAPAPHTDDGNATTAFLGPLAATLAVAMVTGAFSASMDWLYPLRVIAAGVVLWMFRRHYAGLRWTISWRAIAIGAVTFVIWVSLVPAEAGAGSPWPDALRSIPVHWAAAWLIMRVIGYVIAAPLVEELAFRAYLPRRIMSADFQTLPVGLFTWTSFLISSLLFGALHGGLWIPGTIAGMAFALALYQRRALGDAVQAHATTNGLIAVYVFVTGQWSVWA